MSRLAGLRRLERRSRLRSIHFRDLGGATPSGSLTGFSLPNLFLGRPLNGFGAETTGNFRRRGLDLACDPLV